MEITQFGQRFKKKKQWRKYPEPIHVQDCGTSTPQGQHRGFAERIFCSTGQVDQRAAWGPAFEWFFLVLVILQRCWRRLIQYLPLA